MLHTDKSKKSSSKKVKKERNEARNPHITTGYISTFLLLISTFVIYDVIVISNVQDETSFNFEALKYDLERNVHNQPEAVTVILENLNRLQRDETSNVNLIGSTGVGKTFIANILKRHFPSFFETRGSLKSKSSNDIWSIIRKSSAKYNLVVFDDLTVGDIDDLLILLKEMPNDVTTLVICIFNIQETDNFLNHRINYDYVKTIENKFETAGVKHSMAKFQEFSTDDAHNWIVKQLIIRRTEEPLHGKVIESVLESHNVKYHGLKGLSSKLNLEL